jgi:hypothetical protein
MEQLTRPRSTPETPLPTNAAAERTGPQDERNAAARIPDSVAALSYGTRLLAGAGGGPRLF